MLLRASILALAMITTLATTALVTTPASASWSFGRSVNHSNHGVPCSGEHFRSRR
jgi:hypothetical protein